ncbi:MAG: HK97 family phage prohead protease [Rhodovulum sp.]
MLEGFASGELTLEERGARVGVRRLRGRFPYNKAAVLSDGGRTGRPRKEVVAPRAFAYRVERPDEDIHLLIGHSYDRPLASRGAGTLDLEDSDEALTFEATITEEMQGVSYVQDFLAAMRAGLIVGISPGFRIPPRRAVPVAEKVEPEDPALGMALIRTIFQALLYEISLVTRPAYPEAQVEARQWETTAGGVTIPKRGAYRWR